MREANLGFSSSFVDYTEVFTPVLRATGTGVGLASLQCKSPTLLAAILASDCLAVSCKMELVFQEISFLKISTSASDDSLTCRMEKGIFINIFAQQKG